MLNGNSLAQQMFGETKHNYAAIKVWVLLYEKQLDSCWYSTTYVNYNNRIKTQLPGKRCTNQRVLCLLFNARDMCDPLFTYK